MSVDTRITGFNLPAPDRRTQTQSQFDTNAVQQSIDLRTLKTEVNAIGSEINTTVTEVNTAVISANQAATTAGNHASTALSYRNQAETFKVQSDAIKTSVEGQSSAILSAQAQTNALLGLGIGGSYVNADGDLIMSYNDATVQSLAFNANGELIITY